MGGVGASIVLQGPSAQAAEEWPSARRKLGVVTPRLRHCPSTNVTGNTGFDITITRTRKHDGKALPDDVLTTKYDGDVDMICN